MISNSKNLTINTFYIITRRINLHVLSEGYHKYLINNDKTNRNTLTADVWFK